MSVNEKRAFQQQVLDQLAEQQRTAFRGKIALQLAVTTTDRTPAHAQTIAKNILDLLSVPTPNAFGNRTRILYCDDEQIDALSVSCSHGNLTPRISIVAAPMRDFLADLDLAKRAVSAAHERRDDRQARDFDDALDRLAELLRRDSVERSVLPESAFDALVHFHRREAQQQFLGRTQMSVQELGGLFGLTGSARPELPMVSAIANQWAKLFRAAHFRIQLSELPQTNGASAAYKRQIREKITAFRDRYDWVLTPLVTPVALEVVVRPPPAARKRGLHDLDNVLRNYLIPHVLETLEPPADMVWALESNDRLTREYESPFGDPEDDREWRDRVARMPASAKVGLTRYEAWRLPRTAEDTSPGFVSVAVVSDDMGLADVFSRIDSAIGRWEDSVD
jgi:hypothetical protein